jgi:hypothetical protein
MASTGRALKARPPVADGVKVSDHFAVRCKACGFSWNSAAMAEGLRVLGACPKCKGELEFRDAPKAPAPTGEPEPDAQTAPHLVLGVPRPLNM